MMLKPVQGTAAKAKSIFSGMVLVRLCDLSKKKISLHWNWLLYAIQDFHCRGPGELLLVVSHLFAVPVSGFRVAKGEVNNQTWMWEICFASSDNWIPLEINYEHWVCNIETCTGQLVALYEKSKHPTRPLWICFDENQTPTQVSYPFHTDNWNSGVWLQWLLADGSSSAAITTGQTQKLMNMEKSLFSNQELEFLFSS